MSLLADLRKHTMFGFTVFDTVLAFLMTMFIVYVIIRLSNPTVASLIIALVVTIPLGVMIHYMTNTPTPLNCKLGLATAQQCVGIRRM